MKIKLEWEELDNGNMYRSKVPGGWFVKIQSCIDVPIPSDVRINDSNLYTSYIDSGFFYPDPEHKWGKEEKENVLSREVDKLPGT